MFLVLKYVQNLTKICKTTDMCMHPFACVYTPPQKMSTVQKERVEVWKYHSSLVPQTSSDACHNQIISIHMQCIYLSIFYACFFFFFFLTKINNDLELTLANSVQPMNSAIELQLPTSETFADFCRHLQDLCSS